MKTNHLLLFLSIVMMGFLSSCEKKCNCNDCPNTFKPPEGTFTYSDEGRQNEMLNYTEVITMLTNYDQTRIMPLEKALGYEDSRINTYDFEQFKKYLGHIENLSKKAKIKITGLSFIAAAKPDYNGTGKSYQDLMYIPTTTINGKQVQFDPVQSAEQGKLVTFKEMLAEYGYNWKYNKNASEKQEKQEKQGKAKSSMQAKMKSKKSTLDKESGAGNFGTVNPPY